MRPTISILVPFGSEDERRIRIYEWVLERLRKQHWAYELVVGTNNDSEFNRSAARNAAFAQSTGDIVVLCDADVMTNVDNIRNAVQMVRDGAPWVVAHSSYYSLTEEFTDKLLNYPSTVYMSDIKKIEYNWVMRERSIAGVLVVPREAYEKVGGYEEDFIGWGFEDNHFATKLNVEWGAFQRTKADVWHLWHDPGENFEQPNIKHNEQLFRELG